MSCILSVEPLVRLQKEDRNWREVAEAHPPVKSGSRPKMKPSVVLVKMAYSLGIRVVTLPLKLVRREIYTILLGRKSNLTGTGSTSVMAKSRYCARITITNEEGHYELASHKEGRAIGGPAFTVFQSAVTTI